MIHKVNKKKNINLDYIFNILYQQLSKSKNKNEVPVSALVLDPKNKKIISISSNQNIKTNNPCAHAEVIAIIKACKKIKKNRLDGMDLYCTLEPCLMCSSIIFKSKIRRVYFAIDDKKNGALLNNFKIGFKEVLGHKIEMYYGFYEDKFAQLLKNFFKKKR